VLHSESQFTLVACRLAVHCSAVPGKVDNEEIVSLTNDEACEFTDTLLMAGMQATYLA
jgi:hypothetical protein